MDGIGSALTAQVRARVDEDEQLDVGAGLLVLAAHEGDEALDQALVEGAGGREPPSTAEPDPVHAQARWAYLDTISVQGFAASVTTGIGAGCDLSIKTWPRTDPGRRAQRQRQVELRGSLGTAADRREPPLAGPVGGLEGRVAQPALEGAGSDCGDACGRRRTAPACRAKGPARSRRSPENADTDQAADP